MKIHYVPKDSLGFGTRTLPICSAEPSSQRVGRNRHWEIIVKGRRHMPYETKAQALNAFEACAAAPERGFAAKGS